MAGAYPTDLSRAKGAVHQIAGSGVSGAYPVDLGWDKGAAGNLTARGDTPVVETNNIVEDASGTTMVVTKPTDTAEDDLLVGVGGWYTASDPSVSPPAGWTEILEALRTSYHWGGAWYKVAGGSEGASYTWTTGSMTKSGGIVRISGADTSSPINASAVSAGDGYGEAGTCPTVTTTVEDCLILRVLVVNYLDPDDVTPPSGFTTVFGAGSNGAAPAVIVASNEQQHIGATGTADFTWSSAKVYKAYTIAIAPAGGGGGSTANSYYKRQLEAVLAS